MRRYQKWFCAVLVACRLICKQSYHMNTFSRKNNCCSNNIIYFVILITWFFKMLLQNNEFPLSCFLDDKKSLVSLLRVKKFNFHLWTLCRESSNWKARRSTHTHAIDLESLYGAWQQWSGACAWVWWAHKTQAHFQRIVKIFTSSTNIAQASLPYKQLSTCEVLLCYKANVLTINCR